jgi:hypothetical protein
MISQINSSNVIENMFPSKRPYMVKSIKTYAMAKLNYTPSLCKSFTKYFQVFRRLKLNGKKDQGQAILNITHAINYIDCIYSKENQHLKRQKM